MIFSTYTLVFVIILIFSFFEFINERWIRNIVFYLLVFSLILLGGFRYGISSDYFHYKEVFQKIDKATDWSEFLMEYGFLSIFYIFNKLGLNFEFFVFFFCSISISIKAFVIKKISPYPIISLLLYFTFFFLLDDMGAIRRGFACSLVLLAYYFIFSKKYLFSFILILLAASIHLSVLIVIPFLFFINIKFNSKQFLMLLAISILIGLSFEKLFNNLVAIDSQLLAVQKIVSYSEEQYFSETNVYEIGLLLRILFILILFKYANKLAVVPFFNQMFNLYIISVFVLVVFSKLTVFSSVVIYFKIFEIILVPILINSMALQKRMFLVLFFVSYAFFSLYRLTTNPTSDFQEYNSIFNSI